MVFVAVAVGSAVGGMLRYWLNITFSSTFPWPTMAVNIIGSFLIGVLIAASGAGGPLPLPPAIRALLIPGFCGGLTTFSTFSADALFLWEQSPGKALTYIAFSVSTALISVWLGTQAVRVR